MTGSKGLYDPIKAVEGMFNGSVTRIAYALKDPADYGASTKTVLAECAKRFHDALDDCEIQLLDAKWYLEHQLKTNQMRREAQAREMGTAAKRKHDEIKDAEDSNSTDQTIAKKAKTQNTEDKVEVQESKEQPKPTEPISNDLKPEQKSEPSATKETEPAKPAVTPLQTSQKPEQAKPPEENLPKKPIPKTNEASAQPTTSTKAPTKEQAPTEDYPKPTPHATPTEDNDDFFESMFGDPTGDVMGDSNRDDNDPLFDFTADDAFGVDDGSGNQDPISLDTLLPGVESYANQTDNMGFTNNINNDSKTNALNMQDSVAMPSSFSNDFGLPNLNGPNIFDDLLNDESMGGMGAGGNYEDGIDLGDSGLLDIDFDSFK